MNLVASDGATALVKNSNSRKSYSNGSNCGCSVANQCSINNDSDIKSKSSCDTSYRISKTSIGSRTNNNSSAELVAIGVAANSVAAAVAELVAVIVATVIVKAI